MSRHLTSIITDTDLPATAGSYCTSRLHLTRREISAAKYQPDGILVNGIKVRTSHPLAAGDVLCVSLTGRDAGKDTPEIVSSIPGAVGRTMDAGGLDILYEDDDLIAVNKPAGLCTHRSRGHYADTMADLLSAYQPGLPVRAVGRLDRDTSGVVIYARHAPAAARISAQSRSVHYKVYLFAAHNCSWPKDWVHIHLNIRPAAGEKNRMEISPNGMEAYTLVRGLLYLPDKDLFIGQAIPITGRTHQIRVHLAALGHPLLGDPVYGISDEADTLALHCAAAHLHQPFTGEPLTIQAPYPQWLSAYPNLTLSSPAAALNGQDASRQ